MKDEPMTSKRWTCPAGSSTIRIPAMCALLHAGHHTGTHAAPATTQERDAMTLRNAIPILRIFSIEKAYEFYLDYLGFTLEWEHRFADDLPLYAQIKRDNVVFHLSEHYGDGTPGSGVFLPVDDIDSLHQELQAKQYRYARPGVDTVDWGRQMLITDPFGNRLSFCQLASTSQ
jgi:predicted enzyme related to lactoylglutathione lyase